MKTQLKNYFIIGLIFLGLSVQNINGQHVNIDTNSKVNFGSQKDGEILNTNDIVKYLNTKDLSGEMIFGPEYAHEATIWHGVTATALDETHFVVAFTDGKFCDYGAAMIGTISGSTITYGSEYIFSDCAQSLSIAKLDNSHFVIVYSESDNTGCAVIGTASGSSITYGDKSYFAYYTVGHISVEAFNESKFAVAYVSFDYPGVNTGRAVIGSITGSSISFGAEYIYNTTDAYFNSITILTDSKFVISYHDLYGYTINGTAITATVTGSVISFGSKYVFNPGDTKHICSFNILDDSHFVIVYADGTYSNYGKAIVGTVSGSDISFGLEFGYNYSGTLYNSAMPIDNDNFIIAYQDMGNGDCGTAIIGTVSGSSITYGSEHVFNSAFADFISISVFDNSNFAITNRNEEGDASTVSGDVIRCNTWTGLGGSDWNEAQNWELKMIPSLSKDVLIPSAPNGGNFPETNTGNAAECHNLVIESGGHLYIPSQNFLTVSNSLTNNAGSSGLIIKSTASDATGSLLHSSTGVNATIERYLSDMKWHFIGTPIENSTAEVFCLSDGHCNIYLKTHIEATNTWGDWIVDISTPLNQGRGYEVWVGNSTFHQPEIIEFSGILNTGDYTTGSDDFYPLEYTNEHGLNLISNPFPSAITANIHEWDKSNIDNSVWVWDGSIGNYVFWNGIDGTNGGGWGTLAGGIIPSMQAFFILANGSSPWLTIPQKSRTHASQEYYKNSVMPNTISLEIEGNGYKDAIFVGYNEKATDEYDSEYDLKKIFGLQEAPQLYSIVNEDILSINTLAEINANKVVNLGFECDANTIFTIEAIDLKSFTQPVSVFLEDIAEDILINLNDNPSYSFLHEHNNDPNRFLLRFGEPEDFYDQTQQKVIIYSYQNAIFIKNCYKEKGGILISNMLGQIISKKIIIQPQEEKRISVENWKKGVYLVIVYTDSKLIGRSKIVVQ